MIATNVPGRTWTQPPWKTPGVPPRSIRDTPTPAVASPTLSPPDRPKDYPFLLEQYLDFTQVKVVTPNKAGA